MRITRTDLALEGVEQLRQGGDISRLDGVCAAEYTRQGYGVTDVRVATKQDRKSTRLNSSHTLAYRMPSSA